jgi:hypothetical protein
MTIERHPAALEGERFMPGVTPAPVDLGQHARRNLVLRHGAHILWMARCRDITLCAHGWYADRRRGCAQHHEADRTRGSQHGSPRWG